MDELIDGDALIDHALCEADGFFGHDVMFECGFWAAVSKESGQSDAVLLKGHVIMPGEREPSQAVWTHTVSCDACSLHDTDVGIEEKAVFRPESAFLCLFSCLDECFVDCIICCPSKEIFTVVRALFGVCYELIVEPFAPLVDGFLDFFEIIVAAFLGASVGGFIHCVSECDDLAIFCGEVRPSEACFFDGSHGFYEEES